MAAIRHLEYALIGNQGSTNNFPSNFSLNETTDALEVIFQAEQAMTIARLGYRYGARTGTPPTYRISLQGVGTTGNPDGTIKGGGSPASATFTPPADASINGLWQWVTLSNAYTCTRGEFLAQVIDYSSGTVDGSNFSSFTQSVGDYNSPGGLPYSITNNATVRTRIASAPCWGYGPAGDAFGFPLQTLTLVVVNNTTTPDEIALRFKLLAGAGTSYQVMGARIAFSTLTAATSYQVLLYSGTTVLQTATIDSDFAKGASNTICDVYFQDTTLAALAYGTEYRLAILPQGAANITVLASDLAVAGDFLAYTGGAEFYYSSRKSAGAWTDLLTRRPRITPLLADQTATSSGLRVHPGMEGGARG